MSCLLPHGGIRQSRNRLGGMEDSIMVSPASNSRHHGAGPSQHQPWARHVDYSIVENAKGLRLSLTSEQKAQIHKTWPKVATNMTRHGLKIMLRLVKRETNVKRIFQLTDVADENLPSEDKFKDHCGRLLAVMNAVIESMDETSLAITTLLYCLGQRHSELNGFNPVYFGIATDDFMAVWEESLGDKFANVQCRKAWQALWKYIADCMQAGALRIAGQVSEQQMRIVLNS